MTPTFPLLENYLSYMEAALGRSENTVKEYRFILYIRIVFRLREHAQGHERPRHRDSLHVEGHYDG